MLPEFRYHPDPIRTGSVIASDDDCECCEGPRGLAYVGPVYAEDDIETICPWRIADGRAAAEFDAEFTSVDQAHPGIPGEVLDEVLRRTPGCSCDTRRA